MAEKGKEKVTMMKLKVDLECAKCYKKVKKVLCKFPQIRDQLFDEKSNIVIIKVVCCSPERIMDKLCSKGGGSIKTIEIVQPPKPPQPQPQPQPQAQAPPQKPKEAPNAPEKPKEGEKPKPSEKPKESEKPKQTEKPKESEKPKPKDSEKPPGPKPAPAQTPALAPAAKQPGPPPQAMPMMMSQGQPLAMGYGPYYDGFGGGPAFGGYGMPPPQQQPYECYGRPVYDSWGGGPPPSYRQCNLNRCDYFSEENPQSCSIM